MGNDIGDKYFHQGLNVVDLMQVAFVVLKLVGVIDWSWGMVFLPLWIDIGILAILIIAYIGIVLYAKHKSA